MRAIKFKVWDIKEKCWIANGLNMDLIYSANAGCFIFDNDDYELARKDLEFFQYTGLLDKLGKEIYEGDIYKCYKCHPDGALGVIEWQDEQNGWNFIKSESDGMEIIGNIYQNPELIKETE